MKVRSFQLADYVRISSLLETVLSESCCEDTLSAFGRQLSWDSELVLVAEMEEEIVGVMIGTIDRNKGYCYRVAVHPDHQRRGIGKKLIQAMRQRFEQRQVQRMVVPVDAYNETMLPVYEKAGFRSDDFFRSFGRLSIMTGA